MTTWVQIATLTITFFTLVYAIHKYNDSRRPLLFVYTSLDTIRESINASEPETVDTKAVVYSVKNIGKRPAKNITIRICPPFLSGETEYYGDKISILLPDEQHDIYRDLQPRYPDNTRQESPLYKTRTFTLRYKAPGKWIIPYMNFQRILPADAYSLSTQRRQSAGISQTIQSKGIHKS